ncbi:MAG TPA: metal-dependent hydrolase [Thiothrix sp.]|nr:metal-dependent hydrolase [Thiothrix sp.]
MDPVTQGVLGAIAAQSSTTTKNLAKVAVIGALAGMASDLDVLIRSSTDPLLALEFHRQFTHSLFFIPFGGLLCALVLFPLLGKRWGFSFGKILLWCILGFATHGLLDGCTSYGTQLLWPLSHHRFSWDSISIIDPLFTLPLLALIILAAWRKQKGFVVMALLWGGLYLSFGFLQHSRTIEIGQTLAQSRGHQPSRLEVKPSFGNLVVWKLVYEAEGNFYVDAIRPGFPGFSTPRIWQGTSIPKLNISRDFPWLASDTQQAKDIERFRWFSQDYLAIDPNNASRIVDMRYSLLPHKIKPMWGIDVSEKAVEVEHVVFYSVHKEARQALNTLIQMIFE